MYRKGKFRQNLYMMFAWAGLSIWQIGLAFSEIFLSIPLKIISDYALIPTGFFIILLIDAVSKEYVDPIKLSLMHILSACVVFFSIPFENAARIGQREGDEGLSVITFGNFKIVGIIVLLFEGLLILAYWGKIHIQAPISLKKYSKLNFLGGIMIGLISPLMYLLGMSVLLPGSTNLTVAVGALLVAIAFKKEPKLAYILPFKAIRVTVLHTLGGISLFTHNWSKKALIDEALFSGMLQGISGILKESLQKGDVREIHLDEGLLIIRRSNAFPIACVLVADRSTHALRTALNGFAEDFYTNFSQFFENPSDVTNFDSASKLIKKNFPFVPEYQ